MNITVTLPLSPKVLDFLKDIVEETSGGIKETMVIKTSDIEPGTVQKKADLVEKINKKMAEKEQQEKHSEIKIEDIRKVVMEKKRKVGDEKIRALLADFDTKSVTLLSPDRYTDFYKQLSEL